MNFYFDLLDYIRSLEIIDTHEHLPCEYKRPSDTDVLSEWLRHYFSSDLISAGLSDRDLALARDSGKNLNMRWKLIEKFWNVCRNTGYGRSLALAARDIYGIDEINGGTIEELDSRFRKAREIGGHYRFVLKEKSKIKISICDTMPFSYEETDDPFVYSMRIDRFVMPYSSMQMKEIAAQIDDEVNCLDDWMRISQKYVEKYLKKNSRIVCLKCGLAYQRNLKFEKVSKKEAKNGFNKIMKSKETFADISSFSKYPKEFSDWMMHFICSLAHENGFIIQVHTGIQEGNGNVLVNSNPTLLTNLFLEYGRARFDLFHMGYPYFMETGVLAKNFRNVFIDMCWGHIISPETAKRALIEWLDVVPANKINAFGGDYCFVDGVYGHQYIARENVAKSLSAKVEDKSLSLDRAQELARWIFFENPVNLFKIENL